MDDDKHSHQAHQHHPEPGPNPPKPPSTRVSSALSSVFIFLVIPVVVAFLLTAFVIQSYQVDGESMETTLQNHDRLIVDKIPRTWSRITSHQYVPKRGDIIVFNQSGISDSFNQKQLIKRVIGLPGEHVVVKNGYITIYNKDNPAGFNPDTAGRYHIDAAVTAGDLNLTLGPNEIFVCGDNRPFSEDSRYFGPVALTNIVGKLVVRVFPFNKTEVF